MGWGESLEKKKEDVSVFVALRKPFHDGSGDGAVLGVYSIVEKAESRCWRDSQQGSGQPTDVIECILNEDRKDV